MCSWIYPASKSRTLHSRGTLATSIKKIRAIINDKIMRKIIILTIAMTILCFNNLIVYSQINQGPIMYLNSKQIDLNKVLLNPMRIDSIDVNKTLGAVTIFTKDKKFSFYRLTDILKKYANITGQNDTVIFRINNKVIEDTTSILIDDTYFVYVVTERLARVKYLSSKYQSLIIVNIDLESKERVPVIRIRGNQEILDKLKTK